MKIRYTYEFDVPNDIANSIVSSTVIGHDLSAPDRAVALSAVNQIIAGLEKALGQQITNRQGLCAVLQHVSMLGMAYTSDPKAMIKVETVIPPGRQIYYDEEAP